MPKLLVLKLFVPLCRVLNTQHVTKSMTVLNSIETLSLIFIIFSSWGINFKNSALKGFFKTSKSVQWDILSVISTDSHARIA